MKQFRLNVDNRFICEECNKDFKNLKALSTHIYFNHKNKEYYNKFNKLIC